MPHRFLLQNALVRLVLAYYPPINIKTIPPFYYEVNRFFESPLDFPPDLWSDTFMMESAHVLDEAPRPRRFTALLTSASARREVELNTASAPIRVQHPPADVSAILSPAVYILRQRGAVVFIGAGRNPLARIYAHSNHRRGAPSAAWLPLRPITFDTVELRPCTVDTLAAAYNTTCTELAWVPSHG